MKAVSRHVTVVIRVSHAADFWESTEHAPGNSPHKSLKVSVLQTSWMFTCTRNPQQEGKSEVAFIGRMWKSNVSTGVSLKRLELNVGATGWLPGIRTSRMHQGTAVSCQTGI